MVSNEKEINVSSYSISFYCVRLPDRAECCSKATNHGIVFHEEDV